MDEIKKISRIEFEDIASKYSFPQEMLAKDYFLTVLLYLFKDVEGIYFKGGTAINKILLDHPRLSEDIDFSVTKEIAIIKKEICSIIEESELFGEITEDKNVDGFVRIIVEYTGFATGKDKIFIDLNKRASLLLKPEIHDVKHFYKPFVPSFSVKTIAKEEMIAEKVAATIGRNKPRDHFDVYNLIREGQSINLNLVKQKCAASGYEFSILKMFNKAQTLKNRWDKDMVPLLAEPIPFQEVMKSLSKHFKLKEEKENIKKNNRSAS